MELFNFLQDVTLSSFLKDYSNFITALSTFLLFVVTYLLYKIGQKKPLMSIYVKHNKNYINFIDLVIENIGDAPAYDVKINTIKNIDLNNDRFKLFGRNFFIKPKYFAPKQKAETFLASFLDFNKAEKGNESRKDFELEKVLFSNSEKSDELVFRATQTPWEN